MDPEDVALRPYLVRLARRLRLRDGWRLGQRSLWLACLAAALVQLAGRLWPVAHLWLWTLVPLAAWLAAVPAYSALRALPPVRVARRVDLELGLKERLSTAWAFEAADQEAGGPAAAGFSPALVGLQRSDALAAARAIEPRRALPLTWQRRPLLAAAAVAGLALALALLPNPMDRILAEREAVAQAAEEQAAQIDELAREIEETEALTGQEREELLRHLEELAEELRANPGDREEALADLSRLEEALRPRLDEQAGARQAALQALQAQLEALSGGEMEAAEALEALAEGLPQMEAGERQALARALAGLAARAGQAGDASLAQALAGLAQAAQASDGQAAAQQARAAAGAVADAMAAAESDLAAQAALRQALAQVQASRRTMAGTGEGQGLAQGEGQGQGQGDGQGQGQGQGQGTQPGGGGGTQAETLPPARRSGRAGRPEGEGDSGTVGELESQVYVPWKRRGAAGDELFIPGQEGGEGQTQVHEQQEPSPGAAGPALVPYQDVYYAYSDAAHQALEQGTIPPGLRDLVRAYFSQLEP